MIAAAAAAVVVSLAPNPSHFGQLVTATVHGAGTPSFKPFVVRAEHGDTYVLQCLDPACVPGPRPRVLHVAGARVVIVPRTTAAQVDHPLRSFRRQTLVPPPNYRVAPRTLRGLLLATVAALVALAAWLAWPVLRRLVPEERDDRSPLERALDHVRASLGRTAADRRRALDLLARVVGRQPVSREALDLAWSRPEPAAPAVEALVERVERGT